MAVVSPDLARFSFPVIKSARDADGDLRVYGCVTNDSVDRDLERVDMAASRRWLESWLSTGGNIRLQHDPQRPVGKGLMLDFRPEGHYLTSVVVDPLAAELTRKGVLTSYSVGVSRPGFVADPTRKATRVITDRLDGATEVSEVSLVDRPSNPDCTFEVTAKVARQVDEFIAKAASVKRGKAGRKAARRAAETAMWTKAAGVSYPVHSRDEAARAWVREGLLADLDSADPARRVAAWDLYFELYGVPRGRT